MKSYINSLFDYKEVPFEREITIACPREYLTSQLKRLSRAEKKTVAADTIEKGDVVVLSLHSEMEKFNKSAVFITVGSHIFDAEFEEMLTGHTVDESFEIMKDELPVKVTVKSISRLVFPEPTDEMAANYAKEHEIENVSTLEEYRNHVVNSYMEEARRDVFYDTIDEIRNYVLTHSDFEFDEDELNEVIADEKNFIEDELAKENKVLEELKQTELKQFFGVGSLKELDESIKIAAEQEIATILWSAAINGIDPETIEFDNFEYYSFEFLEDFLKKVLVVREEA